MQYHRGFLFLFLILLILSNLSAQGEFPGSWIEREPLPTPRQEMYLAEVGGKIYVSGGIMQNGQTTNIVEVYDPASNSWSETEPMPVVLHHHGLVNFNDKLYVMGGYEGTFFATDHVFEYDPATDEWTARTTIPVPVAAHVTVVYGDKIYLIGGKGDSDVLKIVQIYDPAEDSWSAGSMMSLEREHAAGAVIGSLIYVVAGRRGNVGGEALLESYSPAEDSWTVLADIPVARGGIAATVHHDRLIVLGGEIYQGPGQGIFHQNHVYNPGSDTWREMASMPTPRHGLGAVTIGDTIYVIGGATQSGFGASDENEGFVFTPDLVNSQLQIVPAGYRFNNTTNELSLDVYETTSLSINLFTVDGKIIWNRKSRVFQPDSYRIPIPKTTGHTVIQLKNH